MAHAPRSVTLLLAMAWAGGLAGIAATASGAAPAASAVVRAAPSAPSAPTSVPVSAASPSGAARSAAAAVAPQDRQFVQALGAGTFAAVDAATLAVVRAQQPQVRAYAQQVARERAISHAQLAALARRAGIAMPAGLDSAHAALRQRLDASAPPEFDRAYLARELSDHVQSLELLQAEMAAGRNDSLRNFAASTVNLLRQHDQQLRAVAVALGVLPPGPAGYGPMGGAVAGAAYAPPMAVPQAAPGAAGLQDRRFVQEVGAYGLAEVEAATLAAARAQDPQVRTYAQQVAHDRAAANVQLAGLAQQAGLPPPAGIDGGRLAKRQRLDASTAPQFDLAYLTGEVADHQEAIQLLEGEKTAGQDAGLRAFAAATLPSVMQHFQQARTLQVHAAGGVSPGLATVGADTKGLRR